MKRLTIVACVLLFVAGSSPRFAEAKPASRTGDGSQRKLATLSGGGSGGGVVESDKALRVQGQTRNLSMMLVIKGEKDKIKFGDMRENYRREILNTRF